MFGYYENSGNPKNVFPSMTLFHKIHPITRQEFIFLEKISLANNTSLLLTITFLALISISSSLFLSQQWVDIQFIFSFLCFFSVFLFGKVNLRSQFFRSRLNQYLDFICMVRIINHSQLEFKTYFILRISITRYIIFKNMVIINS